MLLTDGKQRSPATNSGLAKKRVQCLNEALCFVSSSVLADSFVLRNPLLRQAPKRLYAEIDTIFYPNDKEIIVAINSFEKNPMTNYKYDCHGCSPYLNLIKLSNENNKLELIESKRNITRYGSWGNPVELELIKFNDSIYFISINDKWYDMLFYYEFKRIYYEGTLQLIIQTVWEGEVSISETKSEAFNYKSKIEVNKNDLMLIIRKEGTNYIQEKNKIVEINEINKYVFDLKDELLYQID